MKFSIRRNVFLESIQRTLGIVDKKTTMPILNNVLLQVEENRLRVVATDREISLLADYDVQMVAPGAITLSAKKLAEMIRATEGEEIRVEMNDQQLVTLTCGKAVYKILGLPAEDYPSVIMDEDVPLFKVSRNLIRELIHKTAFAVSPDEMRRNLNGVYLEIERIEAVEEGAESRERIRMVATDGHRLAVAQLEFADGEAPRLEKGVIIPRKAVLELRRLLDEGQGEVSMGFQQGLCLVKMDRVLLKLSLIEEEYPDYRRVIPAEKGVVVQFRKEPVLHALKRMNVVSSEGYNGVIINVRENLMMLSSTNPDVGEAKDEMEIAYAGPDLDIGYNVEYLLDAIGILDEELVEFDIGQGNKPGVVHPVGSDRHYCVIMPLRIV